MQFVEKNINFNKNETEWKMENPTQNFRETNFVFQQGRSAHRRIGN